MGGQKLKSASIKNKLLKISFPAGLLIFSLFLLFPSPVKSAYYDFGLLSNVYLLCSLGNSQTSFSGSDTPLINNYDTVYGNKNLNRLIKS